MSKFVIITGSSGEIGEALVRTYLQEDFSVIGIDKERSSLNSKLFYEKIADLFELVKNKKYREEVIKKIKDLLPKDLDDLILINNAAVQIVKPLKELTLDDWDNSYSVNAIAPFFLARELIELLGSTNGHIINVSSIHSKLTKSNFSSYAASKAALESITRSLALELSPKGILVNAVAPAAISTKMLNDGFRGSMEKIKELEKYHPANSIGTPEQLAILIKSITKQKNIFLTGSIIEFNGGIGGRLFDPE